MVQKQCKKEEKKERKKTKTKGKTKALDSFLLISVWFSIKPESGSIRLAIITSIGYPVYIPFIAVI